MNVGHWNDKDGAGPTTVFALLPPDARWKHATPYVYRGLAQVSHPRELKLQRTQLKVAVCAKSETQTGRQYVCHSTNKCQRLSKSPWTLISFVQPYGVVVHGVVREFCLLLNISQRHVKTRALP
jgi:hypothetical protein